jgi:hypothetical protein
MALTEPYSIIWVLGVAFIPSATSFDRTLAMKTESVGHHAATQALLLSVTGVLAIMLIASLILLILY